GVPPLSYQPRKIACWSGNVSIALNGYWRRAGDAWSGRVIHSDGLGARPGVAAAVGRTVGASDRLRAGTRRNIAHKRDCRDAAVIRSIAALTYQPRKIACVSGHVSIALNGDRRRTSDAWSGRVIHC